MGKEANSKPYDLEERTHLFGKSVRAFVKKLPRVVSNFEDVRQLVRSSGSIGANYTEANESLGTKDFLMHIKIGEKRPKKVVIGQVCWTQAMIPNWNDFEPRSFRNQPS